MSQKITFYPLGNAESCLLELSNGKTMLFDYADMHTNEDGDKRIDLETELGDYSKFDVVLFSHAHEDHVKGASDFFYFDYANKYQSDERTEIKELWVSSAFILDSELNSEDARVIRQEARHRLKENYGIKVFAEPNKLDKWLEDNDINPSERSHLIVHAGTLLPCTELGDEVKIFVHAPFSADAEDVDDKNEPSIVLQIRLTNGSQATNILMTGDTPHTVIESIVDISKGNENEDYLHWDIYDIPHHCSYTGLADEKGDSRTIPADQVKELLSWGSDSAVMVASCDKITSETNPPHIQAKRAYEHYSRGKKFWATMEYPKASAPKPLVFEIDQFGISEKVASINPILTSPAPRAG